ncbi:2-C-methyl-D-erythritol 4-phosphate cytidylyltransferase [bacterium]|nr:2-C-methyl-D-erythritol 4-phosphate cytidylyltransferase [bacterium]MBU1884213.1 2-C-methyl-D-erythritol 4-phosphate cytidylyltransferase [bacterium]
MKNVAVILAAGSGKRFGSETPKQYIRLGGKKIIEYTIAEFEKNRLIDEICLVINFDYKEDIQALIDENGFAKVTKIISGGEERYDSSYNAIKAYESEDDVNLIFHDGVRPFVSQEIINNSIKALEQYNAVDVAIESADTIIKIDAHDTIDSIPKRAELRRGQTPQAFKLTTIKQAHDIARSSSEKIEFTDDCGMVVKYIPDEKVYVVNGESANIKITHKEDLLLAEKLLQLKTSTIEDDDILEFKDKTVVIFGASSGIGKDIAELLKQNGCRVFEFSRSLGCDVRKYQSVQEAFQSIDAQIDYVINTTGVLEKSPLHEYTQEQIDEIIDTNFKGSVNIARASLAYLQKSHGMLLFFTSSSYTRGRANYSLYSASKAAIVNLTQALDEEWSEFDIRINCINPARTLTPMRVKNFGYEDEDTLLSSSEVAKKTIQLLGKNISGQIIDIKRGV